MEEAAPAVPLTGLPATWLVARTEKAGALVVTLGRTLHLQTDLLEQDIARLGSLIDPFPAWNAIKTLRKQEMALGILVPLA